MSERKVLMTIWLNQLGYQDYELTMASEDASFRRYFRMHCDGETFIVMDAPPEKESCETFVAIAKQFRSIRLSAPEILKADMSQGFLLMTDFGDTLYLDILTQESHASLYGDAMLAILQMQTKLDTSKLPVYNEQLLVEEMDLFQEWFLNHLLGIELNQQQQTMWQTSKDLLLQNALEQPQIFVHRDFHSRNLMKLENNNPGILDFQDAVKGPLTYDLVSLLRDCYIDWPQPRVDQLAIEYYEFVKLKELTDVTVVKFLRWFNLMGVQRHLKAIGIFSRLKIRDGKKQFLADIPRTLEYIRQVSSDEMSMAGLYTLLNELGLSYRIKSLL